MKKNGALTVPHSVIPVPVGTLPRYPSSMTEIPPIGRVLALDWGELRIGIALSDETQLLASPLTTLVRRRGKRFPMPEFLTLVAEHQPVGLIVGLPLSLDGGENEHSAEARALAAQTATRTGLPVELWDERMSTVVALNSIRDQDGSARGRREEVDSLAASVVLQHFLDARRARR
jgi:putative Holliday junction resolvase